MSAEFGAVSALPNTGSLRDAPRTAPLHRLLGSQAEVAVRGDAPAFFVLHAKGD